MINNNDDMIVQQQRNDNNKTNSDWDENDENLNNSHIIEINDDHTYGYSITKHVDTSSISNGPSTGSTKRRIVSSTTRRNGTPRRLVVSNNDDDDNDNDNNNSYNIDNYDTVLNKPNLLASNSNASVSSSVARYRSILLAHRENNNNNNNAKSTSTSNTSSIQYKMQQNFPDYINTPHTALHDITTINNTNNFSGSSNDISNHKINAVQQRRTNNTPKSVIHITPTSSHPHQALVHTGTNVTNSNNNQQQQRQFNNTNNDDSSSSSTRSDDESNFHSPISISFFQSIDSDTKLAAATTATTTTKATKGGRQQHINHHNLIQTTSSVSTAKTTNQQLTNRKNIFWSTINSIGLTNTSMNSHKTETTEKQSNTTTTATTKSTRKKNYHTLFFKNNNDTVTTTTTDHDKSSTGKRQRRRMSKNGNGYHKLSSVVDQLQFNNNDTTTTNTSWIGAKLSPIASFDDEETIIFSPDDITTTFNTNTTTSHVVVVPPPPAYGTILDNDHNDHEQHHQQQYQNNDSDLSFTAAVTKFFFPRVYYSNRRRHQQQQQMDYEDPTIEEGIISKQTRQQQSTGLVSNKSTALLHPSSSFQSPVSTNSSSIANLQQQQRYIIFDPNDSNTTRLKVSDTQIPSNERTRLLQQHTPFVVVNNSSNTNIFRRNDLRIRTSSSNNNYLSKPATTTTTNNNMDDEQKRSFQIIPANKSSGLGTSNKNLNNKYNNNTPNRHIRESISIELLEDEYQRRNVLYLTWGNFVCIASAFYLVCMACYDWVSWIQINNSNGLQQLIQQQQQQLNEPLYGIRYRTNFDDDNDAFQLDKAISYVNSKTTNIQNYFSQNKQQSFNGYNTNTTSQSSSSITSYYTINSFNHIWVFPLGIPPDRTMSLFGAFSSTQTRTVLFNSLQRFNEHQSNQRKQSQQQQNSISNHFIFNCWKSLYQIVTSATLGMGLSCYTAMKILPSWFICSSIVEWILLVVAWNYIILFLLEQQRQQASLHNHNNNQQMQQITHTVTLYICSIVTGQLWSLAIDAFYTNLTNRYIENYPYNKNSMRIITMFFSRETGCAAWGTIGLLCSTINGNWMTLLYNNNDYIKGNATQRNIDNIHVDSVYQIHTPTTLGNDKHHQYHNFLESKNSTRNLAFNNSRVIFLTLAVLILAVAVSEQFFRCYHYYCQYYDDSTNYSDDNGSDLSSFSYLHSSYLILDVMLVMIVCCSCGWTMGYMLLALDRFGSEFDRTNPIQKQYGMSATPIPSRSIPGITVEPFRTLDVNHHNSNETLSYGVLLRNWFRYVKVVWIQRPIFLIKRPVGMCILFLVFLWLLPGCYLYYSFIKALKRDLQN